MTWINFDDAEAQILAAGIAPDKPLTIDVLRHLVGQRRRLHQGRTAEKGR